MQRGTYFSPCDVMVISDHPIEDELSSDIPWSGYTNRQVLHNLASRGVPISRVHQTYLSYEKIPNDWQEDITRTSSEDYFQWPHCKNTFYSRDIFKLLEELKAEIKAADPKLILVFGKWSLFFLTGRVTLSKTQNTLKSFKPNGGLATFRGSLLPLLSEFGISAVVFPMLPQSMLYREPKKAPILSWDFDKAGRIFKRLQRFFPIQKMVGELKITSFEKRDSLESPEDVLNFNINSLPLSKLNLNYDFSSEVIIDFLRNLLFDLDLNVIKVSVDIETKINAYIDCIGITKEIDSGLCIPFSTEKNPCPWSLEVETEITYLLLSVLTHRNIRIVGQNYNYDAQFIKYVYGISTAAYVDTMVLSHTLYNTLPKSLDFLASVVCDNYAYWKDEQTWDEK
jgi:uracil-DNA glycosylase